MAGTFERRDRYTRGDDHESVGRSKRDPVAWLDDGMLCLRDQVSVDILQEIVGTLARLDVCPVIPVVLDWDLLGELGEAAVVIPVPVRDDQIVDLREPGITDRFHDAACIARGGGARIAGVDE